MDPIPTTGPTASRKAVRERRRRASYTQRQRLADYRVLLSIPQGRRVLWQLLEKAGVFTQVDIESTNRVLVNEGKRSIGLFILAELMTAQPNALEQLRAQHQKDETTDDA